MGAAFDRTEPPLHVRRVLIRAKDLEMPSLDLVHRSDPCPVPQRTRGPLARQFALAILR